MEDKRKLIEAESVKKFAFFGVDVSTIATLTAIVAVTLLCVYMQNVQSGLQDEITFCRIRSQSLRGEFTKAILKIIKKAIESLEKEEKTREKRQAYQCCSCGVGPAGPDPTDSQEPMEDQDLQASQDQMLQMTTSSPDLRTSASNAQLDKYAFILKSITLDKLILNRTLAGPAGPKGPPGIPGELYVTLTHF
ncbi:hypothetical protein WR25_00033 [Diploscapter pachys]|uniref:Nematode cuticle collagen N-terminal domain-containing protein n=1 Tax=Diploscapter pachys TaxID=2018661 RepID=A0A2A2KEA7_9BILA|nr:hypothetical protein WR25_00033 [Diploscapter pachys]